MKQLLSLKAFPRSAVDKMKRIKTDDVILELLLKEEAAGK